MEIISILTIGILSGLAASTLCGYSLGVLGNGISGATGALFLGKYLAVLFGMSSYAGMFAGGAIGALVVLVVFNTAESLMAKKKRLF